MVSAILGKTQFDTFCATAPAKIAGNHTTAISALTNI